MDAYLPGCRKKAVGFETAGARRPGYPLWGRCVRLHTVSCTQRGCQKEIILTSSAGSIAIFEDPAQAACLPFDDLAPYLANPGLNVPMPEIPSP
jgi:hypothetical protein